MLEFRNVSVSVQRTQLLSDMTVNFPKGQITTVIGPNGCGKTTLLQCLNGVSHVTGGEILLEGEDFLKLAPRERAKRLAFLPQVRTVIPAIPVRTLVEHGRFPYLGFARRKTSQDVEIVQKAMELAGVSECAGQYVDTLSGGIRQRVFFAMILAQDCDYIVLDEPATYLDMKGQREFQKLMEKMREQNKTVIAVVHDLQQALQISDQIVVMKDRKIVAVDTPEECIKKHIIEEVFETKCKQFEDSEGVYYLFS